MLILSAKRENKSAKHLNLYLNGEFFRRGSIQCFARKLKEAKEFQSKEEMIQWVDQIETRFTLKKAYDYLAARNYPSSKLKEKLLHLFLDPEKVEKTIAHCAQSKYCDDLVWIEQFIAQQLSKGYGPQIIQAKLHQKKLPLRLIQKAISKITLEEQRLSILQKIEKLQNKKTPEEILGYLQRRGFSLDLLYEIIKIQ